MGEISMKFVCYICLLIYLLYYMQSCFPVSALVIVLLLIMMTDKAIPGVSTSHHYEGHSGKHGRYFPLIFTLLSLACPVYSAPSGTVHRPYRGS